MTETGDVRPWWRTSGDDGDDPIARLLEEPGAERQAGSEAGALDTEAAGEALASDRARGAPPQPVCGVQPFRIVTVAVVAGFLAIVLVLVAALSAGRDSRDGVPNLRPAGNGSGDWPEVPVSTTCNQAPSGCRPVTPGAVSAGADPAPPPAGPR